MLFKASLIILYHSNMFEKRCWVNWIIVKGNIWVKRFWNFPTKNYFLSSFTSIAIEIHFPLVCPLFFASGCLDHFWKYEYREQPRIRKYHLHIVQLVQLLSPRNKKVPRMEPWEKTERIYAQEEHWPLKLSNAFETSRNIPLTWSSI